MDKKISKDQLPIIWKVDAKILINDWLAKNPEKTISDLLNSSILHYLGSGFCNYTKEELEGFQSLDDLEKEIFTPEQIKRIHNKATKSALKRNSLK